MTAIANLPDIRPSLLLDFANSGRVDPRIQCTRASAATCFGPDGKLRTVPANVPRIDYDPVTGKCLGLLVEEARTNLALYSGSIRVVSGAWSATRCTLSTVENVISPVGMSAAKMVPDGTGSPYFSCLTASAGDGVSISGGVYVKSSGASRVQIDFITTAGFSNLRCALNFADGTIAGGSAGSVKVEKLADSWFRIYTYGVSSNGAVNSFRVTNPDTTAGDANSFYVSGAQVELGAFPTSYIPTESSAVTRARDVVTMSTAGWYNSDGSGAVLSEFTIYGVTEGGPWSLSDGVTTLRGIGVIRMGSLATRLRSVYRAGDTAHFSDLPQNSHVVGVPLKLGTTFNPAEGIRLCQGGGSVADAGGASGVPVVNTLRLGDSRVAGGGPFAWSGVISRLTYYPEALLPAQLQRLTA